MAADIRTLIQEAATLVVLSAEATGQEPMRALLMRLNRFMRVLEAREWQGAQSPLPRAAQHYGEVARLLRRQIGSGARTAGIGVTVALDDLRELLETNQRRRPRLLR